METEHKDVEEVCKGCGRAKCFCTCDDIILSELPKDQQDIAQDKYFERQKPIAWLTYAN